MKRRRRKQWNFTVTEGNFRKETVALGMKHSHLRATILFPHIDQGIQEWTKSNFWKTAFENFGPFLNTLTHVCLSALLCLKNLVGFARIYLYKKSRNRKIFNIKTFLTKRYTVREPIYTVYFCIQNPVKHLRGSLLQK